MLASLSNKAMESVWTKHKTTFHKRLLVCDPTFGPKFLQQVHVHYNINLDPEMMTKKLQLLISSKVNDK